jgi:DNA-binding IclR family transcriptional regulator
MNEQSVPYSEPRADHENGSPVTGSPAPMVERALRLLDLVSTSEEGLTLSELARALNMSKGSMHGLLKTLESAGALELTDDRSYVPGPRIYTLAQRYVHHAGLRRFALPAMQRLAEQVGETVFLGRVEPRGVRIIESAMHEHERNGLRISAPRGTHVHLLAGATGRVLLASWPPAEREEFVRTCSLPHFTERSLTDPATFLAAIEETAHSGIGIERGEYLEGVNAVAAPIHGPGHELVALLWIVGFSSHLNDDALTRAADLLHAESRTISHSLGAAQPQSRESRVQGRQPLTEREVSSHTLPPQNPLKDEEPLFEIGNG